jgi:transcriptional regulator with XRE-family HTH domain
MSPNIRFEEWEEQRMQDPEFRAAAEALEPGYQVARVRILQGLTQQELATRVGTKQPSIARLESGTVEPRLSFLRRVAEALGARLELRIVASQRIPLSVGQPFATDRSDTYTNEESIPAPGWPRREDLSHYRSWTDHTPAVLE